MFALRIDNQHLSLRKVSSPQGNGEAVVRVVRSGICGTDLELVKGYSGFEGTPGHEFVGIVETSNDRPELVGKRVVGEINVGCGRCDLCKIGDPRHCPTRTVLGIVGRDGAHAEFLTLPVQNLYEVPTGISNDDAVFVEPLAAAVGINERIQFETDCKVAVVGDGKLGLLCARSLDVMPPAKSVTLIGKSEEKLRLASKAGIDTLKSEKLGSVRHHFDVVIEASGSESGFSSALEIVKPRGTVVLKSTYHGLGHWDASRVVVNEVSVIGSRCGRFEPALELLASNQISVDDLISDEFSLSKGVEAFARAGTKGVLKILMNMEKL